MRSLLGDSCSGMFAHLHHIHSIYDFRFLQKSHEYATATLSCIQNSATQRQFPESDTALSLIKWILSQQWSVPSAFSRNIKSIRVLSFAHFSHFAYLFTLKGKTKKANKSHKKTEKKSHTICIIRRNSSYSRRSFNTVTEREWMNEWRNNKKYNAICHWTNLNTISSNHLCIAIASAYNLRSGTESASAVDRCRTASTALHCRMASVWSAAARATHYWNEIEELHLSLESARFTAHELFDFHPLYDSIYLPLSLQLQ